MLSAELIQTRVRNRTGLSTNDLSEDVITDAIESALIEYSKHNPQEVYGAFPTIENKQDYPMPDGTVAGAPKIDHVKDVLYSSGITATYPFFDKDFPITIVQDLFNVQFGGNVFENLSLSRVLFSKLSGFRKSFGALFEELKTFPPVIRLFPTPVQADVAYYRGTVAWSLTDKQTVEIENRYEEAFIKAVLWKVAEGRANRLAVMNSYSESGGVSFQPAFKFWQDMAKQYRSDFLDDVGANVSFIAIG